MGNSDHGTTYTYTSYTAWHYKYVYIIYSMALHIRKQHYIYVYTMMRVKLGGDGCVLTAWAWPGTASVGSSHLPVAYTHTTPLENLRFGLSQTRRMPLSSYNSILGDV